MRKLISPFEVEKLRTKLASQNRLKELRQTYSAEFPEIEDFNTSSLWDNLNFKENPYAKNDPMALDRVKRVKSMLKTGERILNIGIGSAKLESMLSSLKKWYGIDISPKSVSLAKKKFKSGDFKIANITNLPYPDLFFDTVIALEILEHIKPSHLPKALSEVKRVIKRGGRLIISIPLNEGLEELIKMGKNPNAHVRVYTEELIKAELRLWGFRPIFHENLYAFRSFYIFKSYIVKFTGARQPNDIIVVAEKE